MRGIVRQTLANGAVVGITIEKLIIGDVVVKQPFINIQEDGSHVFGTVVNIRELKTQRVVTYDNGKEFRYQRRTSRVMILHTRPV